MEVSMLEMKTECERCGKDLARGDDTFICSYECTFCRACTEERAHVCPNCQGELVARPKRLQREE